MASSSTADDKDKRKLTYNLLEVSINEGDKTVSCTLKIPSKLSLRYDSEDLGINPTLLLALQCKNADGHRCFQMMKEIIHPNILHARAINSSESQLLVWVEPYTSNLLEYLRKSMVVDSKKSSTNIVLPTRIIRNAVWQTVDGLNHLRFLGSYHGNFTMESTYFHVVKSKIFVKLTNFKGKGALKSVSLCQCEDLNDLGTELTLLSIIADNLNKKNTSRTLDTFYLDDLAKMLKHVTQEDLDKTYDQIKKHPFFWQIYERKKNFVYRVATKMKTANFWNAVQNCDALCTLPWDLNDHDGFLPMMQQFRSHKAMLPYNGMNRCDFVLFICALYTHEREPFLARNGSVVDDTVTNNHPHIFMLLSNLLQSSDTDWL